jgi:hypothetical protein
MTKIIVTLLCLLSASVTFAAEPLCQRAVENQEKGLASESRAMPEDKTKLSRQLRNGEFTISKKDVGNVLALLQRTDTLAFSFGNDAGGWLSIANAQSCKILLTIQVVEI